METTLKTKIVNAAEAVKRKVRKMRDIETNNEQVLKNVFKPLTEPLHHLANLDKNKDTEYRDDTKNDLTQKSKHENCEPSMDFVKNNMSDIEYEGGYDMENEGVETDETEDEEIDSDENKNNTSGESFKTLESDSSLLKDISSWSLSSEVFKNIPFGIRNENGKLKMGSSNIQINENFIIVANRKYKRTSGLEELIMKKIPDLTRVKQDDTHNYKQILLDTNAHRRDYDPLKPIKSNKGFKYLRVIKPLFQIHEQSKVQGKGVELPLLKKWKPDVDYVYWDDPNELVERLKLLIASRDAGNTGLNNEIISVIEELREHGILNK